MSLTMFSALDLLPLYIRFVWQGFGSRGAPRVASVRRCQKLPPCLIESMPAGSKTDPPLPEAEPISKGGGKKTYGIAGGEERSETV